MEAKNSQVLFVLSTEAKLRLENARLKEGRFKTVSELMRWLIDCYMKGRIMTDENLTMMKYGEMMHEKFGGDDFRIPREWKRKAAELAKGV